MSFKNMLFHSPSFEEAAPAISEGRTGGPSLEKESTGRPPEVLG